MHPLGGETEDSFLSWSVQIELILRAKRVWHVLRVYDTVSLSLSHQVQEIDAGSKVGTEAE